MNISRPQAIKRLGLPEDCKFTKKELCNLLNDQEDFNAYNFNPKCGAITYTRAANVIIDLKAFSNKQSGHNTTVQVCPNCKQEQPFKSFMKLDRSICKYCLDCRKKGIK